MSTEKRETTARIPGATERDREWVGHFERIEAEGIAAKDYAAREGLSRHALYQAKKRLRQQGAWPELEGSAAKPTFARVRVAEPVAVTAAPWALRLRLPSGAVLEWSAQPGVELLGALLAQGSAPR